VPSSSASGIDTCGMQTKCGLGSRPFIVSIVVVPRNTSLALTTAIA
jgi:hypothetical protein